MKIAYMMLVDWHWIKQRPHFIAEGLAQKHDVTVFYQFRYGINGKQKNRTTDLKLRPIFVIPRGDRISALRKINKKIKKWIISRYIEENGVDCVYLTYPDQIDLIPSNYAGRIVYDCMDDHSAFLSGADEKRNLEKLEQTLMERADHVLVSSEKLREVLLQRYDSVDRKQITVVRNAFNGKIIDNKDDNNRNQPSENAPFTVAYFGTISKWFDFELLQKSVADFPNVKYILMGPIAGVSIPDSSNIEYRGIVEHDVLFEAISDADCLIMPFVVNEIVESVDPVKLYEYINFQKNILCVEYSEIRRFEPFVSFYSDYASYRQQLEKLLRCNALKYTEEQRRCFLSSNDWGSRVEAIEALLEQTQTERGKHGSS